MKKIFLLLTIIIFLFILSSCNVPPQNDMGDTELTDIDADKAIESETVVSENKSENDNHFSEPPYETINIYSIEELKKMREMLECEDEEQLQQYLDTLGSGARSKTDLEMFLTMADRFLYVNAVDGEVCLMHHSKGISIDTGKNTEVFYIAFKSTNGDWIRYEYLLSGKDMTNQATTEELSFFEKPLTDPSKKMVVLSENREVHPSGVGELVTWFAKIDGIDAYIVQYSSSPDQISVDAILKGTVVKGVEIN